jgi:hypothetical protein
LLPFGLFAQTLEVGSVFPNLVVKDQFEKEVLVTPQTKKIIIAFTKAQGEVIKTHLKEYPEYLQQNGALYFMDASSVPSMIMNLFMLPKFKKYPYKIGILEEDKDIVYFPKEKEKMTVIDLDNLHVKAINFTENL